MLRKMYQLFYKLVSLYTDLKLKVSAGLLTENEIQSFDWQELCCITVPEFSAETTELLM